jgi:hypothetical protein
MLVKKEAKIYFSKIFETGPIYSMENPLKINGKESLQSHLAHIKSYLAQIRSYLAHIIEKELVHLFTGSFKIGFLDMPE